MTPAPSPVPPPPFAASTGFREQDVALHATASAARDGSDRRAILRRSRRTRRSPLGDTNRRGVAKGALTARRSAESRLRQTHAASTPASAARADSAGARGADDAVEDATSAAAYKSSATSNASGTRGPRACCDATGSEPTSSRTGRPSSRTGRPSSPDGSSPRRSSLVAVSVAFPFPVPALVLPSPSPFPSPSRLERP